MGTSALDDDSEARVRQEWTKGRIAWRVFLLALTGVSIYLLLPSLIETFSSWRSLSKLDPLWAALIVPAEALSYVSVWILQRIALQAEAWFPIATSQLAANAAGRVMPAGGAASPAIQIGMLRRAGIGGARAAAALAAAGGLLWATLLALPLLSLPAILAGTPVAHNLAVAAYLGAAVLVLLLLFGTSAFVVDKPLWLLGRWIQWVLNETIRRKRPVHDLGDSLLEQRDFIRRTIGRRWFAAVTAATAESAFDYIALLAALRAVGASPQPSLVLIAYVAAALLGVIPVTPGGLGFVEAGLIGMLTLSGVNASDAVVATLAYRLAAFWLPIPVGGIAYLLFRHRYR